MAQIDNLNSQTAILAHGYKTMWIAQNRGIFAQVARQLKISRQAVSAVWRGEKRNRRVERAFRRLRAPGFEAQKKLRKIAA